MNLIEWMIPPFIGSLIGYFTNWLAIKMLFRPYEEKRIFGIRIPFTPGLIPKEKKRLSKKVGTTVGEHLLTEEVLVSALTDQEIQDELRKGIGKSIVYLQQNKDTMDETLAHLLGDQKKGILKTVDASMAKILINQLRNTELQDKALNLFINKIETVIREIPFVESFGYVRELLLTRGIQYIEREEFQIQMEQWVQQTLKSLENNPSTFHQVVPEALVDAVKQFISNQGPNIAIHIGVFLDKPEIQEKIKTTILQFVNNHFGKLALVFMNVDKIYDGLIEELKKYLQDEQNQAYMVGVIQDYIDKVLDEKVCDLVNRIPDSIKSDTTVQGIQWLTANILTKDNIEKGIVRLEEYIRNKEEMDLFQMIEKMDPDIMNRLKKYVKKHIQSLVYQDELQERTQLWIQKEREKILQKRVDELADLIKPSFINNLGDIVLRNFNNIVVSQSSYIIQLINIPKVVEERIDSFDVRYTEQIILSIAQRELRAITWFGALLGFIMAIILNFV